MKKYFLMLFILQGFCLSVLGQEIKANDVTQKGIQIGQQVPDLLLTNLHNYRDKQGNLSSSAKISDFKGKLLILDFWATWCSPCVAMIPKMDSLQQEFKDKYDSDIYNQVLNISNSSLNWFYRIAFGEGKIIPPSRTKYAVKDSSLFKSSLKGDDFLAWLSKRGYNYYSEIPVNFRYNIFKKLQKDLEYLFPQFKASLKLEERECLVLVKNNNFNLTHSNYPPKVEFSFSGFEIINSPIDKIIDRLSDYYLNKSKYPLLNETNIIENVNLKVTANMTNIESINNGLKEVGLEFIIAKRIIPILVLEDVEQDHNGGMIYE